MHVVALVACPLDPTRRRRLGSTTRGLCCFWPATNELGCQQTMHENDLRLSNALRAPLVLTILALRGLALERCLAFMADLARSLGSGLLHISSRPRLRFLPFGLLSLCRITWAFPAARVIAVAADAIHAVLGLTAVACAMNPHADLLFHPRYIRLECCSPFTRVQGHVVLGKHSTDLFLLNLCALSGCHCHLRSNGNCNWL